MKIVQINAVYQYSSTGRNVSEFHDYLVTHGHESYKFYSVKNADSLTYDLIGCKIDHKIHALGSRLWGKQGYFSYFASRKLISKLSKLHPDAVILHNLHSNYIHYPSLLRYLAKNNIPTIVVLHDCWFFTGHCCHYTSVNCFKWRTQCEKCPLIHCDNASYFFDHTKSIFKEKQKLFSSISRLGVVGVSEWITSEAKKSPIFSNAKIIRRIYNWIDLKVFYPRDGTALRMKLGLKDTDFVALGVSMSWDNKKGLDVFIELAKAFPTIVIIMIGVINNVSLPNNIINVQPTSSMNELAEYYSLADVFLNFSIQETFGKVAAEALACGTPLIVNRSTANPELVCEDCGFIINNNDLDSIMQSIRLIQKRGKLFYKDKCVKRANTLFEKESNLAQYLNLITDLL